MFPSGKRAYFLREAKWRACMKIRAADVAVEAGVSRATVSRVFNRNAKVKSEVKDAVLKAATRLNYAPARSGNGNFFSLALGHLHLSPYNRMLTEAIFSQMIENGHIVEIIHESGIERAIASGAKGIIAFGLSHEKRKFLKAESARNPLPLLTVNDEIPGIASISTDHAEGIELAVKDLHENGHKKICCILNGSGNPDEKMSWGKLERSNAFEKICQSLKLKESFLLKSPDEKIVESLAKALKKGATAIIMAEEGREIALNYAVNLLDRKIPDQLSLICYENAESSQYMIPPCTTIDQNIGDLGRKAALQIVKISEGRIPDRQQVRLNVRLIKRESVKDIRNG